MSLPEKSNIVSARNLVKKFHSGTSEIKALNKVSFDIHPGDFVAVMGASGSGKSTLLHLLAGLIRPDEGSLAINGIEPFSLNDKSLTLFRRDHIGLIFQSFNLIPTLTVEENVSLPLLAGYSGDVTPERLTRTLTAVGLEDRRTHLPDALSGGEQQRTAIARALITNPSLILADEPTGNLDSMNGEKICDIFTRLNAEEGKTILLVTHEPTVALRSRRLIILRDGEIISDTDTSLYKTPLELAAHYQKTVVSQAAE